MRMMLQIVLVMLPGIVSLPAGADTCSGVKGALPFIDKNACPGEGCQLGEWVANQTIPLVERPDGTKIVYTLVAKEKFLAEYGENHVIPVTVRVNKKPGKEDTSKVPPGLNLKVGDTFLLMTNLGEAWFSACKDGQSFQVEGTGIANMPDFGKPDPKGTWAVATGGKGPAQKWWVRIKTKSGVQGWIPGHSYDISGRDKFE